jgi:hypothetical protein
MLRPRDSRSDKHNEMQDDDDAYYITENVSPQMFSCRGVHRHVSACD